MNAVITLRPASDEDDALLYEIYASTRAEEVAAVDWPVAQKTAFLQMQFAAQRQHYLAHYPAATCAIVQLDGLDIGRLILDRTADEILLMDIALLPVYRNCGIGAHLIAALQTEAQSTGKSMRLHVHNFSPAIRLYQRLGFTLIAEKGFYWEMTWRPDHAGPGAATSQAKRGIPNAGKFEAALCV